MNTRRENRLEELGRVDAEKAYTSKGKRNLREEKSRIRKELKEGGPAKERGPAKPMPSDADKLWKQPPQRGRGGRRKKFKTTHGGGPDAGNIGKLKDALSKARKVMGKRVSPGKPDLSKIKEKMPKYMKPLRKGGRAKYASGGVVMAGKKVGCQIK